MPPSDRPAGSRPPTPKPATPKSPAKKPAPRKASVSNSATKKPRPVYDLGARKSRWPRVLIGAAIVVVTGGGVIAGLMSSGLWHPRKPLLVSEMSGHMTRPYGMAPVAYEAFLRACNNAGVNPFRIGQTIGNHPLSAGYHLRDGTLKVNGQDIAYTAAVDLGGSDLDEATRTRFLQELTKQGFACWYRGKGKWAHDKHIHAIYALLPMKSQLRGQVKDFLDDRRARGMKPYRWEKVAAKKISLVQNPLLNQSGQGA